MFIAFSLWMWKKRRVIKRNGGKWNIIIFSGLHLKVKWEVFFMGQAIEEKCEVFC